MKVFVSHAAVDRELALKFEELLQLGIGIPPGDIFLSSRPGSIPNGQFFVQHILNELNNSDLVIAILSSAYFKSQFCLAEAGAALARQLAGHAEFYSVVVPPEDFSDLAGVLYGLQTGSVLEPSTLEELRDRFRKKIPDRLYDDVIWGHQQRAFLRAADSLVSFRIAEDLSNSVKLQTMEIDRTSLERIRYKLKLWIVLKNETGTDIDAGPATWKSGLDMVRLQSPAPSPLVWQVETDEGWDKKESANIRVPDSRCFRTWIGVMESTPDKELFQRYVERRLGELVVALKVSRKDISWSLKL